jgi:hypothetical protein
VFLSRLRAALPERAGRVENHIRAVRGGKLNDARFFARQRGSGTYWDLLVRQWEVHARRLGFDGTRSGEAPRAPATFRRPSPQGSLF